MYDHWLGAKKVCVIGAGTMGSGIAAHLANLGFQVTLLDVTRESAEAGLEKAKSARPPHFFVPERAAGIRLGGIDTDLGLVADAEWVCEAVVEKLDVKRALFERLETVLSPDAMISTNTSGLQIALLAEGRSESFRRRFLGTHFFNPPRYLKLLELIPTAETDPAVVSAMTRFLEDRVARRVVLAKDTPGFIANRYGMWSMFLATHVAERLRLSPEAVDLITGPFLGRPRSGTFRLNDLVGLDIMQDIARNLIERCPHDPNILPTLATPSSVAWLSERGWIGEKVGQGYYRKEGRELLTLDIQTLAYRQRQEVSIPSIEKYGKLPLGERIKRTLEERDEAGEFLRAYLPPVLQYAEHLKQEISHSVLDFDRVMMWGFGWEKGPFGLLDAAGLATEPYYDGQTQRDFSGTFISLPVEPQYATIRDFPVVSEAETYLLRDLGDGVTAISLKTKMGVISPALVDDLTALLEHQGQGPYLLTSEARVYSVGFDLTFFDHAIADSNTAGIDTALAKLQRLGELLEKSATVCAVHGYALGAGLELALSCPQIVAAADAQIGLPEMKVGLLPGGRGTTLTRVYNQINAKRLCEVAVNVARGAVAANADEARIFGYLRPTDLTAYHPDSILMSAKQAALSVKPASRPAWAVFEGPLNGQIDRELEEMHRRGELSDYDKTIADRIRFVFAKATSYEHALELERKEFLDLCAKALTHARIQHMLSTNKPLRN